MRKRATTKGIDVGFSGGHPPRARILAYSRPHVNSTLVPSNQNVSFLAVSIYSAVQSGLFGLLDGSFELLSHLVDGWSYLIAKSAEGIPVFSSQDALEENERGIECPGEDANVRPKALGLLLQVYGGHRSLLFV